MEFEAKTRWLRQTNFTFATCVAYLKSHIDSQDDPTTLILQYQLLKKLDDKSQLISRVGHKIEDCIDNLVDIQDSGFQFRDCLMVTDFARLSRWHTENPRRFETIVLPRLKVASLSNWFNEPELAASVLSIESYRGNFHFSAKEYLTKNIISWMDRDYLHGVLYYALHIGTSERLNEYLNQVNWDTQSLTTKSLALRYFSGFPQADLPVQLTLSESIYSDLGHSEAYSNFLNAIYHSENNDPSSEGLLPLTDYEITLAILSINEAKYDELVGFKSNQEAYLKSLQELQDTLKNGGTFISRMQIVIYEFAILLCVALLIHLLLSLEFIADLTTPIIEGLVQYVPIIVLVFLRRKRLAPIIEKWITSPGG